MLKVKQLSRTDEQALSMYKEKLLHYAAIHEYVKPRDGASPSMIHGVEKDLDCTFPPELKSLLLETNGDGYLFFSTDEILETNTRIRTMMSECYEGLEKLVFFAGHGCGDYNSYKILSSGQADSASIYIWMHEDNELRPVAYSLADMIDRYFNDEI